MGSKRVTHERFLERCYTRFNDMDNYVFLTEYKNISTKIKFSHSLCGNIHSVLPTNFLKGNRCKYCPTARMEKEKLEKRDKNKQIVNDMTCGEYSLLEFAYAPEKSKFKHNACGNVFDMLTPNFIRAGQRCPLCSRKFAGNKRRKTNEEFLKQLSDVYGNDYELLEEYRGVKTKIDVMHVLCGNISRVTPDYLLHSKHLFCSYCAEPSGIKPTANRNFAVVYPDLLKYWDYENNNIPPFEYTPSTTKLVWWICENGHSFQKSIHNIIAHFNCPYCPGMKSRGENQIKNILHNNHIRYNHNHSFDDCRRNKFAKFKFDFYLLDKNLVIEYDGIEHFEAVDWGWHKNKELILSNFEDLKVRDSIKNDYCKNKNILMLRIPYWDFDNIENILVRELNLAEKGG